VTVWHFVCTGNICRSPFAGAYARLRLGTTCNNLSVASCGTQADHGLEVPATALQVAAEFGVDLSTHLAQPFLAATVDLTGLYLCMEEQHVAALLAAVPELSGRVELLGSYAPPGVLTEPFIADPFGLSSFHYRACYTIISRAVDGLIAARGPGQENSSSPAAR